VRLRNQRLGWFLNFLRACTLGFILYTVSDERPWYEVVVPMGALTFWAEGGNPADTKAQHALVMKTELCDPATRGKYDYQFDNNGNWIYFNNTCRLPSEAQSFFKGEGEMFIPTYVSDSIVTFKISTKLPTSTCKASCASLEKCRAGPGFEEVLDKPETVTLGSNECYCSCSGKENYFHTTARELRIVVDHAVSYKDQSQGLANAFHGNRLADNLKTVVRHHDTGQDVKTFEPGSMVSLSVAEIMEFAGTNLMDPASFTNENRLTTPGKVTYPPLWLTGVVVDLHFEFFNLDGHGIKGYVHDGPLCLLNISTSLAWSSKPVTIDYGSAAEFERGEVTERLKYQYGIRIVTSSNGKFSYFSYMNVFFFLASSAVYLSLPMLILHILIWFFLGDLSDVMDNILHETPDWNQRFALFVTKALMAKFVHGEITKTDDVLDDEIKYLADAYHEDDHDMQSSEFAAMRQIVQGAKYNSINLADETVSEAEFLRAFTEGETLKDVWKMFDSKRKRPFLQRLLDGNLHHRMHIVKTVSRHSMVQKESESSTAEVEVQIEEESSIGETNTHTEGREEGGATSLQI